ncbi:MAG: ribosomal L7Ae/L30e/S12e/Gadd45 family protein [Nanobdellota archaeon]
MAEEPSKETLEKVFEAIEVAKSSGRIKKGANEVTKSIEKGEAKLAVTAKDANPPEVIMHIPLLSEEKGVKHFAVGSKEELGVAAGLNVSTTAVAITKEGDAKKIIEELTK